MMELLAHAVYFFIIPNALFYFYSRCCFKPYIWYQSIAYTVLSGGLFMCNLSVGLPSFVLLFLKVCLLAICGRQFLGQGNVQAFSLSTLVISVDYLANGLMQSLVFGVAVLLSPEQSIVLKYLDFIRDVLELFFLTGTFLLILKFFSGSFEKLHPSAWALLAIPLLFISMVEQIVSASLYGTTVVWDSERGLIHPVVNHGEMILLHVFSWIGMGSTLVVFEKLMTALHNGQIIELLKLQARVQADYALEAKARYNQTRAFRHDVKNHLMVLKELLTKRDLEKANAYLTNLEIGLEALSFPVQTNHVVVDALLGSKLAAARQSGLHITCEMKIPNGCRIQDLDWCILLANAIDNAIEASRLIAVIHRSIRLYGEEKGNLYFLQIENTCRPDTEVPIYGIGLSNIAAVVQRYRGEMEIEVADEKFRLTILLVTS